MIVILKPGNTPKKFKTVWNITCPKCGCEFECEAEDFTQSEKKINGNRWIKCPCCEEELNLEMDGIKVNIFEREVINPTPYIPDLILPNNIRIDKTNGDPCENCINKDGPKDVFGNPTVGDSPCQWCRHYKYKLTCQNQQK